jgi:predicted Zn-dependent peptidase
VGDVDPAEVARVVEKKLGRWRPLESPSPVVPADPPPADRELVFERTDKEQAVIYIGYRGVTYGDGDEFPLRLLDAAISGVYLPGGRLHERLRDAGYVYVVHAYNVSAQDPGFFAIFAATSPERAEEVLAAVEEEVAKIKAEPITAEELGLAQENWLTMNALYNNQSNADVAGVAARYELVGLGYDWLEDFDERVLAVTADDVTAAARKYLVNPVIVVTTPTPPGEAPPSTPETPVGEAEE